MPLFIQSLPYIGVLLFCLFVWYLLWRMRRDQLQRGQEGAVSDARKEALNDVQKANDARDRLRSDPDYARRVRNKFSRD